MPPAPILRPALTLLLVLAACAAPSPERPRDSQASAPPVVPQDLIPYRTLGPEDFKGIHPPPGLNAYRDTLGAFICVYVLRSPSTRIAFRRLEPDRIQGYVKNLGFVAQMDRNCSWWNPDSPIPTGYRLQHEQVHFGLTELYVRTLNARAEEIARTLETEAPSGREAREATGVLWETLLQQLADESLEERRRFDEETSFGYETDLQARWWSRVERDLARTSEIGSGPP